MSDGDASDGWTVSRSPDLDRAWGAWRLLALEDRRGGLVFPEQSAGAGEAWDWYVACYYAASDDELARHHGR